MSIIKSVKARQILDSRGNPTIEVDMELACGSEGRGIVPSGASTGALEALELRDGDNSIYLGKSVINTVNLINKEVSSKISSSEDFTQESLDKLLIDLDGTDNKKRLGANAILGVSLAFSHANAKSLDKPLYKTFSHDNNFSLPVPMMNIINGGAHANNSLDFQEFMILPIGFDSFSESLRAGVEIFHGLKSKLNKLSLSTAVGDEGGFAPNISSNKEALEVILDSISHAGYEPGAEVFLGLDVASSEFYKNGKYELSNGISYTNTEFCDYLEELTRSYPIISVEDGMSEDDWEGWSLLTSTLSSKLQLVGDDVFVTNPKIFEKGIKEEIANAILIKFNQIGTITETLDTIAMAKKNNYNYIISHRSGETEDVTIADLAVGTASGQIKTGSLSRSDRTSKYNQLLRIEEELGTSCFNKDDVFGRWMK
ncbi:MAG: phosphopyruvate hydratase [Gammaproteobacteria bacterium]|nr:phosphopyruvate hydratase [Gammaproteobacteria bacterium]